MTPSESSIPFGFCHCGCGKKAPLAKTSNKTLGYVSGDPVRFIVGHNATKPRPNSRIVVIDGVNCRTIPLTQGKEAIVDLDDFDMLNRFVWTAVTRRRREIWYAVCIIAGKTTQMHRLIVGNDFPHTDHKNGNGLDNRRSNLRPCSALDNMRNKRKIITNTSGYKGVAPNHKKFAAFIGVDGKSVYLGTRDTPEEAAKLYDSAAIRYFGDFAHLNFPHS